MMRLLGAVALAGGVVACSTHESAAGRDGQDRNEAAKNKGPQAGAYLAPGAAPLYVTPGGPRGWAQVDIATGRYCEKVAALVNSKWEEYREMNLHVLTRRGYVRTVLTINPRGKVEDIRVLNSEWSYPALTQLALRAIKDAKLPPMSAAVISSLLKENHGCLKMEYMALNLFPR